MAEAPRRGHGETAQARGAHRAHPRAPANYLLRQRPTLPGSYPPSTISAGGGHVRVRDGNGWIPSAMATGTLSVLAAVTQPQRMLGSPPGRPGTTETAADRSTLPALSAGSLRPSAASRARRATRQVQRGWPQPPAARKIGSTRDRYARRPSAADTHLRTQGAASVGGMDHAVAQRLHVSRAQRACAPPSLPRATRGGGQGLDRFVPVRWSALPRLHSGPIYLVVYQGSYLFREGDLILGRASRLDAFSAYPVPTPLPSDALGRTTGTREVGPPRSSRTRGGAPQVSYARDG